ncbi:MAG: hypothetical protein M3Y56_13380 [Armatimonadota bacterium]|nr:hypothetical protein [Armatimonadota bacterium]
MSVQRLLDHKLYWKLLICAIVIICAGCTSLAVPPGRANPPSRAQQIPPAAPLIPNTFIALAQHDQLSIGQLLDALASTDTHVRHQAAEAIVALRNHDIEAITRSIDNNPTVTNPNSMSERGKAAWNSFDALAYLRPSQSEALRVASRNILFHWQSAVTDLPMPAGYAYRASAVLEQATLPALSTLLNILTKAAGPQGSEKPVLTSQQGAAFACVTTILGPATLPWLKESAMLAPDEQGRGAIQTVLDKARSFSEGRRVGQDDQKIGYLIDPDGLRDPFDTSELDRIDPQNFKVDWTAADKVGDITIVHSGGNISIASQFAARQMKLTFALLSYNIAERLDPEDNSRQKSYKQFPPEAQLDALRVLGCLRYRRPWVAWERLRRASLKRRVEEDSSEETAATLRTLGQIDIPAAQLLIARLGSELAEDQQRAAAFTLGKIMGRYSVPFIEASIRELQSGLSGDDRIERQKDRTHINRLQAMLKLGQEKHWFEGDFYGVGDPHAYDLIFPDEAKPAGVQPPATPPVQSSTPPPAQLPTAPNERPKPTN